jgi:hypothetical protein
VLTGLLERAIRLFPGGIVPEDVEARDRVLDGTTEAQLAELDTLSDRFSDYPGDLRRLIDAYVEAHDAEFRGPRTLLEMWHSRR